MADETIKAGFVLLDNGQTAWVVTLFDDAFRDPTDISILISSPDGAILDVQTTNIGYFKTIRDRWQEKMGDADTWPLEMKALFDKLYTVHGDSAVPDDTMIQQEQAAGIALQEIPDDLSVDQIRCDPCLGMRLASCHFKVKTCALAIIPISVFDPSQSLVQGKNIKNTSIYSREVHLIPFSALAYNGDSPDVLLPCFLRR